MFIWAFTGVFVQRWQEVNLAAWTAAAAALLLFVQLFFLSGSNFTYLPLYWVINNKRGRENRT